MPHGGSGYGPSKGPSNAKKGVGGACHAPSKPVDNVPTASEAIVISNSSPDIMCPELFEACRAGKVERVQQLLSHEGVSGLATDFYGKTCFHSACFAGQEKVAEALLEKMPILLTQNADDGTTPLMSACEMGQIRMIRFLCERKIDMHASSKDGTTALMKASERGSSDCVEFLLKHVGVDANIRNEEGYTALLHAARKGHTGVVKILLEAGADSSAKLVVGTSAFTLAQNGGHDSTVKALDLHTKLQARKANRGGQQRSSPARLVAEGIDGLDERSLDEIMADLESEQTAVVSSKKSKKSKSKAKNTSLQEVLVTDEMSTIESPPAEVVTDSINLNDEKAEVLLETSDTPTLIGTCKMSDEASLRKLDIVLKESIKNLLVDSHGIAHVDRFICRHELDYILTLKFTHKDAMVSFAASDVKKDLSLADGHGEIKWHEFEGQVLL